MAAPAMTHDEAAELIGAYALDALDAGEAALVEVHLAECPRCMAEVARHHEVAGLLANTGADAPAELWERIADRLGPPGSANWDRLAARLERPKGVTDVIAEHDGVTRPSGPDQPGDAGRVVALTPRRMWRRAAVWAATAAATAAAVLAVVFGVQVAHLDHQVAQLQTAVNRPALSGAVQAALEDPATKRVRLAAAGGSSPGSPTVTVAVTPAGTAYLIPHGLASLPSDQTYQLWGKFGDRLISLGLLGAHPTTTAFTVNPGAPVTLFAITTEPAQGVVQPTRPPTVQGTVAT
jgi:anti-sigma factor RsiW